MTQWFEEWFGEDYLRLYPHRDEVDAARLIELVDARISLRDRTVLDLACGPGRHGAQLSARGAGVTGLDLSPVLVSLARATGLAVVRGDMRAIPFASGSFDVVVNLFTSFGYFEGDAEHLGVLRDVARVLRPGGAFVIDYLNPVQVEASLIPEERTMMGSEEVDVARRITGDGRFVEKMIRPVGDGRVFRERVRLFAREELEALVAAAGLEPVGTVGDYEGAAPQGDSPRTIIFAEKR